MNSTSISIRVRYGETDQMGIVYHGNYPAFLEQGRIEFFREIGIPYKDLEEQGVMLPVIDLNLKFIRSAYFDDLITVQTILTEIPTGVRLKLDYKIFNQNQELLTEANTVLAFIDKDSRKPIRCPESLKQKINAFIQKN